MWLLCDVETGEVVDGDAADWNTEGQPKELRYDPAQLGVSTVVAADNPDG